MIESLVCFEVDLSVDTILIEIAAEEKSLVRFFGKDYEAFRERTRTGIPFVR